MRPDDIETEIGEKDKSQTLDDIQLICDLRVDLAVIVVMRMYTRAFWMVEREVKEEEKSVIDDEACCQLQNQFSARGRRKWKSAPGLNRGRKGKVVECRGKEGAMDCLPHRRWIIIAAEGHLLDIDATEFLNESKIKDQQWCNVRQTFSQAILWALELRYRLGVICVVCLVDEAEGRIVDEA